jgi:PAS domain S-box-containing protein
MNGLANRMNQTRLPDAAAAFFWTDPDGVVTAWTAAAEQLLGWSAADVIGQQPPFIGSESADLWSYICRTVKLGASVQNLDMTALASDGAVLAVRLSSAPNAGTSSDGRSVLHIVWRAWLR